MEKSNAVPCPAGEHELAWLETDAAGKVVVVIEPGPEPGTTRDHPYPSAVVTRDNTSKDTLSAPAACPCGVYSVDLIAVLLGREQTALGA